MAAGVRLQHPTARNARAVIVDQRYPYRVALVCNSCTGQPVHTFKTYHLDVDETGSVIVSQEMAERVMSLPYLGFAIANEVKEPPTQRLVLGAALDHREIVLLKEPN